MAYYVRALANKVNSPRWKIQFIVYKYDCAINGGTKSSKRTWDIPRDRWRILGFHSAMDMSDAKARVRQLNAQLTLKRQEERVRKIADATKEFRTKHDAVLPDEFVAEFENRFIRCPRSDSTWQRQKTSRSFVAWRAAQRMIVSLGVEPMDWYYHVHNIYDYLYELQLSLGYIHSIIKVANFWGFFISRKLGKPFLPVPLPKGYERQRLLEAYYRKEKKTRRPSLQLTPHHLAKASDQLNRPNFNWLFISIWFGLRPQEIDNLHNRELWYIESLPTGRKILWVFQTKIIALPPEDRWKPIPILFSEQEFALKVLSDGNFKRPLGKTMRFHFGRGFDLYGGRKGFTDLMLERGHSIENISIWMGHSTLSRTWRSYKNKRRFHL